MCSSLYPLRSEREDKARVKHRMAKEDRGRIGFACVVGKKPEDPKIKVHIPVGKPKLALLQSLQDVPRKLIHISLIQLNNYLF